MIKVTETGQPEQTAARAQHPANGANVDKALAIAKVAVYIAICFATSWFLQGAVLYAYRHIANQALFYFVVAAFDCTLALVSLYFFSRFIDKRPFLSYGFSGGTVSGGFKQFAAGCGLALLMVSSVMLFLYLAGYYKVLSVSWNVEVLAYLPFFFVAALREEVMFRGYVLQTLEKHWGTFGAIVISSFMFGLLHLINFEDGVALADRLYSCVCLSIDAGLVFSVAYLATRKLWFPFGLHFAWNVFEGPVYGTLVSSLTLCQPILVARLTGPFYLTGGVFGPEASLIEVAACLVLVGLLWRRARANFATVEKN